MNSIIIAVKNTKRIIFSKSGIIFLLIIPLIVVSIIAIISKNSTSKKNEIVYQNLDEGKYGSQIIDYLKNYENYKCIEMKRSEIENKIKNEDIRNALIIPKDFSNSLNKNKVDPIEIINKNGNLGISQISGMINKGMKYVLKSSSNYRFKASNKSNKSEFAQSTPDELKLTLTQGFLLMFILLLSGIEVNMLNEDKESGIYERMYAAPIRPYEMALGNFLSSIILGVIQLCIFILGSAFIIKMEWGTSIINVFIVFLLFMLSSIGMSFAVAAFIKNIKFYIPFYYILVMLTCLLGGCFIKTSIFPGFLKKISDFIPQSYVTDALIKLKAGNSLYDIRSNLILLLMFITVFFIFGIKSFLIQDEKE